MAASRLLLPSYPFRALRAIPSPRPGPTAPGSGEFFRVLEVLKGSRNAKKAPGAGAPRVL